MSLFFRIIIVLPLFFSPLIAVAQSISGYVYDEENNPVPYARITIKDTEYLTTSNFEGRYFIQVDLGDYEVVYGAVGYNDKVIRVLVRGKETTVQNVHLEYGKTLQEAVVKAGKKDPAYAIIDQASKRRNLNQKSIQRSRCNVYIKAIEEVIETAREDKDLAGAQDDDASLKSSERNDGKKKKNEEEKGPQKNMAELILVREFEYPNKIKETRTAIKKLGDTQGLYYLTTVGDEFNFYDNMVNVPRLAEAPLISPLNTTAVLHYKFKLVSTGLENGRFVYKIEVKQKTRSNSTVEGHIWIVDTSFAIRRVELSLQKSNLKGYDRFNVVQEYDYLNDTVPIMVKQVFTYGLSGKKRSFEGSTTVGYSDFEFDPVFPKNYFSNEVGTTVKDAYEKDSSFWNTIRPVPLSKEEHRYQFVQDSIRIAHSREEYLDSVDRDYNRITWDRILYFGVHKRSRKKKQEWGFGSLLEYFQPVNLGGIRIVPYTSFFKKWKNERWINTWQSLNYGITNNDLNGQANFTFHYAPMRNAQFEIRGGRDYEAVNPYTSFVTAFQRSNYFRRNFLYLRHQGELFNGLMTRVEVNYADRQPLKDFDFGYTGNISSNWFGDTDPFEFEGYQALITEVRAYYTPYQKFIREPYRKVILGSKWPSFYLNWRRGWSGLFGSDINFDYLGGGIEQSFNLFSLGNSRYNISVGRYVNTKNLQFIDSKFFRISDPFFLSHPLRSFQMLNRNLVTTDWFVEGHYLHHFTGGLSQKIPLLRRLGLRTSAGAGFLWLAEDNFLHAEMLGGMERIFQIGRVRFRTGLYYAVPFTRTWRWYEGIKFSIEFYSNSQGKWRF